MTNSRFFVGLLVLAVTPACDCGTAVRRTFPKLEILDDQGADRSTLDFGQVQLNSTATARIRMRNAGTAVLNLSAATFANQKFGLGETLPVTIEQNGEHMFAFTFKPTEPDLREMGTVTLTTDDPSRPMVQLTLFGTGIAAVATVMPRTLDFGEVYVNEDKSLDLTVTNAGSNALEITNAALTPASPPGLTANLTPLKTTLNAGASATTSFRFAPTATGDLSATLDVTLGGGLDPLRVNVRGKAIEAVPKICFKFDDSPLEGCADRANTMLQFPFGSLCDNRLFPADGGVRCTGGDGGVLASSRSGRLSVRNEGNTPVSYAFTMNLLAGGRCDAGVGIDFEFSNAPSADAGRFNVPTFKLPNAVTDPRGQLGWEAPPVTVTYRPTSRCRDDGADQVQIFWTRQNEPIGAATRQPQAAVLILTGQSLLPRGVTSDLNITLSGQVTSVNQSYNGLSNIGDAPLTIRAAQLWQAMFLADGGTGAEPFEECLPGAGGACRFFWWATPPTLPTTLAGTPQPNMPVSRPLGQIAFGQQDGGVAAQVGTPYRIFAVFETDDPYGSPCPYPTSGSCVISTLRAIAQ
ncbi:MAG: choice-of-anchor D domain-containing protein [Myxococcaceae bacterium]|nr:choice-of-anchor D domain-containing protein [Myxococcaceae bacterium]